MVVEVPIATASLADAMSQMRNWLDKRRCTPTLFGTTPGEEPGTVVIRVEFDSGADAAAFYAAFGPAEPEETVAAA